MMEYQIKIGDRACIATEDGYLKRAADVVRLINEANGWYDADRTFGDDIALLHSEVSEALEAFRNWNVEDVTVKQCIDKNFRGDENTHSEPHNKWHTCKPEGVGSELADVLVRLLDTCSRYGVDLEDEFHRKLQYNATRGYRHGNRNL